MSNPQANPLAGPSEGQGTDSLSPVPSLSTSRNQSPPSALSGDPNSEGPKSPLLRRQQSAVTFKEDTGKLASSDSREASINDSNNTNDQPFGVFASGSGQFPLPRMEPKVIGRMPSYRRSKRQSVIIEAPMPGEGESENSESVEEAGSGLSEAFPLRDKLFLLFEGFPPEVMGVDEIKQWTRASIFVVNFTLTLVLVSCFSFAIETLPQFWNANNKALEVIEIICISWFTFDVLFRLALCRGKRKFLMAPLNVIDIVSVLPFYIDLILGEDSGASVLIVLRVLRLIRVLRVFKLSKHNQGMAAVFIAISRSRGALTLMFFMLFIVLLIGSSAIYFAAQTWEGHRWDSERRSWVRPNGRASPFQSILHCMWFAIVTLTTVGYGDDYPEAPLPKAVAGCLMIIGAFVVAFPTVILSANFHDAHESVKRRMHAAKNGETVRQEDEEEDEDDDIMQFVAEGHRKEAAEIVKMDQIRGALSAHSLHQYSVSEGAPNRRIVIKTHEGVALYEPFMMLVCSSNEVEAEYGFRSSATPAVHIRENYPSGLVARFQLLLHTNTVHTAAVNAMHQLIYERRKVGNPLAKPGDPPLRIEPRPIRSIKVEMNSSHALLSQARVVNPKLHDPFGIVPLEVYLPKLDSLPILLKYSMSCLFRFRVEFYDSAEVQFVDLSNVDGCALQPTSRKHSIALSQGGELNMSGAQMMM